MPRFEFRRWPMAVLKGLFRAVAWLFRKPVLLALLILLAAADFYCETYGLPAPALEKIRSSLKARGVVAGIGELRAGVVRGVVAERVTVYDAAHPDEPMLEVQQLVMQPDMKKLLTGTFRPQQIRFEQLGVYLPADPARPQPLYRRFLGRLSGQIRLHRNRLEVVSLQGDLAGVRVQVRGDLTGLRDLPERPPPEKPFSWEMLLEQAKTQGMGPVLLVLQEASRRGVPQNDGWADISFSVPVTRPARAVVSGSFSLSDLTVDGVDIRKVRSRFLFRDGRVNLQQFNLQVPGDQSLTADLEFNTRTRLVSGQVQGVFLPDPALRLFRKPVPELLRQIRFHAPLQFSLTLAPSPWDDPEQVRADLAVEGQGADAGPFSVGGAEIRLHFDPKADPRRKGELHLRDLRIRGIAVRDVAADVTADTQTITVSGIRVEAGSAAGENLAGTVTYRQAERQLSADLRGNLMPATILALIPGVPDGLLVLSRELTAAKAPQFACTIEPSPAQDPAAWKGRLDVTLSPSAFRDVRLQGGSVAAAFAPGTVHLASRFDVEGEPAQTLNADFTIRPAVGRLQGTVAGSFYADRLYRGLRLPNHYIADRIHQNGTPLKMAATIEDSPLSPAQWTGSGTLATANAAYEDLVFKEAASGLRFQPGKLCFPGIKGVTAAGETLAGDIAVGLPSGDLDLNAVIRGDPRLVRVFVSAGESRAIYDQVWKDFAWDPADLPEINLKSLTYRQTPDGTTWTFGLKAHIFARNSTWRQLKTQEVETDIDMDLPRTLILQNCRVKADKGNAAGGAELYFQGLPICRFRLAADAPPRLLLHTINPEWDGAFEGIRFGDATRATCEGNFFLGPEPRPVLRGTLDADSCWYKQLRFDRLAMRWYVDGTRLGWNPAAATLYKGNVFCTGFYDFNSETGQFNLNCDSISLGNLLRSASPATDLSAQGKLASNCRVDLYRPTPGAPLALKGTGRVWVSQGDLWNLPIMNRLGQIVGLSSLGRISRLDADLTFRGNRVEVPEFTTDGTILALRGNGAVNWTDQTLDFKVHGVALEKTYIIPWLLKPFFSMFDAELTGTVDDPAWKRVGNLKSVFSGSP